MSCTRLCICRVTLLLLTDYFRHHFYQLVKAHDERNLSVDLAEAVFRVDERETGFGRGIVVALDVADVTCGGEAVALGKELDVLILLEKVVAVAFDVFYNVFRVAVADLVMTQE